MSDSDTRPDREVEEALDTVLETIEQVPALLSGEPVDVNLAISVHGAMTPQEAVDQFMATLTRNGSDKVFFFIEDPTTGERFAIKGGVLYDPDELLAERAEESGTDENDDEDDDERD